MSDGGAGDCWQSMCGIQKIIQTDRYGCGIACLAMVTGTTYENARHRFNELGLGARRRCRPAYSTSSREMLHALAVSGLIVDSRRWRGWSAFHGLGVLKVRDDWRGAKNQWHWVVAFKHSTFGVVVFDPHQFEPSFQVMPDDVLCFDFQVYEPKGEWFQVEQRLKLEIRGQAPAIQEKQMNREVLSLWTIYERPKDYPTQFVARRFEATDPPKATSDLLLADDLDGIRNMLPAGLYCLPRQLGDDPVIIETWL